jgi:hypothetical protein
MPKFNLDVWWDKNVDPNLTPLDQMYKEITQEAVVEVLRLHKIIEEDEDALDLDDIDMSDVL